MDVTTVNKPPVKVAIWGFGAMGSQMADMILNTEGFIITGICDLNPKIVGKSIFELLKRKKGNHPDVYISNDIEYILKRDKPDVVMQATDSFTKNAYPKIITLIEHGCNVISTAEEMADPSASNPDLAKKIDAAAKAHGVSVLGTGVNPGMMMDVLAIFMTGVMKDITSLDIKRVNSLSPFGKTVMEEQGVGLSKQAFDEKIQKGELAGHVGFRESTTLIAKALGLTIESFTQTMKPIIAKKDRKSPYGFAKKGNVCGVDMQANATLSNGIEITMSHPQQIEPHKEQIDTGDYITINGTPPVHLQNKPEIEGGIGTVAICVNMIPHIINAEAGLKTMIDLPVPRLIAGDVRNMIKRM